MANEKDSFVRPLAEGLARMLTGCGVSPEIHYDGLEVLSLPLELRRRTPRGVIAHAVKSRGHRRRFDDLVERVRGADAVVVVAHVPGSLSRHTLQNIGRLRARCRKLPIVNYDLIYLPTVEKWGPAMLRGEREGMSPEELKLITPRPYGLERYDWYLVGSPASELPMPPGPQPFSWIGIDIDDGTLYPAQGKRFHLLLDFEQDRGAYPGFRKVQLEALKKARISYEILEGRYSRDEIRAKYREAGGLMLAHRESFGLPICEVQACGGQIFLPRAEWAGAHWIKQRLSDAGPGKHSSNFVVYRNTVDALVDKLITAEQSFDPTRRLETFMKCHPQLYRGDRDALKKFLAQLESGAIHSKLHSEHVAVGRKRSLHKRAATRAAAAR